MVDQGWFCQRTVCFQFFNGREKRSLQHDVVWASWAVKLAEMTVVSFHILNVFPGQPYAVGGKQFMSTVVWAGCHTKDG